MMRTDARHGGLLLCSFKLRRRRPSYIYRKPINPACIFLLALRHVPARPFFLLRKFAGTGVEGPERW